MQMCVTLGLHSPCYNRVQSAEELL